MFNRIDASKSTKGASKLRRDLINAEIANLRDLLPLPPSTRQRLSQLQLMALVCVFLRKANYFQHVLKNDHESTGMPTPNIGFSKAMSGFIMMMTQQGKLLYISENAAEYLGHSMEDLLIHGDSVYDVVDKQDHMVIQNQLARSVPSSSDDRRLFLCRINVSRNSRRQLRFGDQKVVLVEGHYLPFVPLCNRNESVFLASCTPVVLPETRESVVQGATNIFTTIHSMDMKYLHIDKTAESHMEYSRSELVGVSWYNLLHWDSIRTAYCKHQTVVQSDQERSATALLRLQSRSGRWFWIHCVLQVKDTSEECQHPIIVCTNQVLSEKEAEILRASSWLYQYSSQTKFTYGVCPTSLPITASSQPTPTQAPQQPVPHLPHADMVPYSAEATADYNNGRPHLLPSLPYNSQQHDIPELGMSPYHQPMDDGHVVAPWSKERTHVKQEPAEVYSDASVHRGPPRNHPSVHGPETETAEPVDMSINNSAPEPHHERHLMHHCSNTSGEYCPCKAHLPVVEHNNKSPNRGSSIPSSVPYLRPNSKALSHYLSGQQSPQRHHHQHHHQQQASLSPQQHHQQMSPVMAPSPDGNNGGLKYNIVDLDKLGHNPAPPEPAHMYGGGPSPHHAVHPQKRHSSFLLLHHQAKATGQPGADEHPCLATTTDDSPHHHHHLALHHMEQWTSPAGGNSAVSIPVAGGAQAIWSDCGLQRVPDVVHQELSPYITTPTTPADPADDSSEHRTPETPASVFNFDWPGEQHVPNLRVLTFRNSSSSGLVSPGAGYLEPRRPALQEVQPITLQLPRKKNFHAEASGHRDYAK
ncbi:hypoxia-inducible factor 3-alpha [Copidosoma floridanum]|uniref:hypoxia-inducible factor 3-alpha n=1 Tax=Copidosoma floridanum TaxID=29053 RepID=UPI0006C992A0|nr:hypoxia-inducible factor 3-alpha [Copidosoma floridanum]